MPKAPKPGQASLFCGDTRVRQRLNYYDTSHDQQGRREHRAQESWCMSWLDYCDALLYSESRKPTGHLWPEQNVAAHNLMKNKGGHTSLQSLRCFPAYQGINFNFILAAFKNDWMALPGLIYGTRLEHVWQCTAEQRTGQARPHKRVLGWQPK